MKNQHVQPHFLKRGLWQNLYFFTGILSPRRKEIPPLQGTTNKERAMKRFEEELKNL